MAVAKLGQAAPAGSFFGPPVVLAFIRVRNGADRALMDFDDESGAGHALSTVWQRIRCGA
jgi:hypothetical protein